MSSFGPSATTDIRWSFAQSLLYLVWVSLRASFFLRFDSPSKFAVETQTTPSTWQLSITTMSAGSSWSARIFRTSPTRTCDQSFSFGFPFSSSAVTFLLLISKSACPRCRSSRRAMTAVTIIIMPSVAMVEKALIVPMNSVVCSPSHIITEMTVKYWFPNFMNCSWRFLGTNVYQVYFVVVTTLLQYPASPAKQDIARRPAPWTPAADPGRLSDRAT
mmetsp:Transcript_27005/g.80455  ORF Transcript_27005/g.80455 Transcript_27005/m.80455 type:complete len:217 (-) Transcript_27005:52-702(-)